MQFYSLYASSSMCWLVTKGDLQNMFVFHYSVKIKSSRGVASVSLGDKHSVNEWLQFAPRMKEKRNKRKQKS